MPVKKKKTFIRREWTKEDIKVLKSLARQKLGVARIAKKLKRTAAATAVQASKLGVSLAVRD